MDESLRKALAVSQSVDQQVRGRVEVDADALRAALATTDSADSDTAPLDVERLAAVIHDAMPDEHNWWPYFRRVDEPDGWSLVIQRTLSRRIAKAVAAAHSAPLHVERLATVIESLRKPPAHGSGNWALGWNDALDAVSRALAASTPETPEHQR